jgi:hypothetical protein
MKVHIARNGEVFGEWTQTELYPLLRVNEVLSPRAGAADFPAGCRDGSDLLCRASCAPRAYVGFPAMTIPELEEKLAVDALSGTET